MTAICFSRCRAASSAHTRRLRGGPFSRGRQFHTQGKQSGDYRQRHCPRSPFHPRAL